MTRPFLRTLEVAGAALALALLACGSSGGTTATMNVHLVDGPAVDYTQLNLHILRVELAQDGGGWITLGTPDRTVDLLSLTGGVEETLVQGKSIPAGSYGQLRLVLGPGNTVCDQPLVDGVCPAAGLHDLKVPSGLQSRVKLVVSFVVQPNTTKDVFIDFDAHRSVFVHETGASAQYILRPTVRAFDKVVTGAVTGFLTDAATAAPLAGVEVMAETLDAGGHPSVARTAKTAADGSYVLDLLPVGGAYWVVAQPRVGTAAYAAGGKGPFDVTETAPIAPNGNIAFAKVDAPGAVDGSISPAPTAEATDEVTAMGTVSVAGVDRTFVLRTAPASLANGAESYAIDLLPPATYALAVTRATPDGAGGFTYATGATASATVTAGGTAHVSLAAP